ncbi:MAG: toll/interleukin-1 receptor domain-containing protein [Pseudomonadota bacterium]|nr:toll/interleukin-1 receptor domain-containing protein [Gammaproteobacteria bacterium]MDQ3583184.1 toll/interleukin-1 receptor domain-containing protein [Pseudomonadota bacterium]
MTQPAVTQQNLIFLNHANPEDNDFTLWLGARLASVGYSVWSDVTKLIGGEIFWDNIEVAIRQHSAKVVSIFSRAGAQKNGFKNELSLALAVEKKQSLTDFVIPLRLDALDFSDFPPEIIRRNAIDFSSAWQDGLGRLLKKLELDGAPRSEGLDADALSNWSKALLKIDADIVSKEEPAISNWLEVVRPPPAIVVSRISTGASAITPELLPWPVEFKGEFVYSFARLERRNAGRFEQFNELDLQYFLSGGSGVELSIGRQDAHNIVVSLLRQAWDRFARSRGLQKKEFTSGRAGYFVTLGQQGTSRTSFVGPTGVAGSRALIGYSQKRAVNWHYAPELLPMVGKTNRFSIKPHVLFSEDGDTPITDVARAHRLRRGFCKNWWQDRWRDLMLAYLAYLSGRKESIEVPLSDSFTLLLSAKPTIYISPVTAVAPGIEQEREDDDQLADEAADDLDDDEEDDDLLEEGYPG